MSKSELIHIIATAHRDIATNRFCEEVLFVSFWAQALLRGLSEKKTKYYLKFPGVSCNYAFVLTEMGCLRNLQ